jgi:hypothetical protein
VAIAALVLWLCTAAIGSYMLATSFRAKRDEPTPAPPEVEAPPRPLTDKERFDPLSLQLAKAEPLPGLKDLTEFAHPALAMIGFGVWFGYVVSRDRVFLAIGVGILLGAITAGLSWFTVNTRAGRRAAAPADSAGADGQGPEIGPLIASPRLIVLHAIGAALTLLIAALVAARV